MSAIKPKRKNRKNRGADQIFDTIQQTLVDKSELLCIQASRRVKWYLNPDAIKYIVRDAIIANNKFRISLNLYPFDNGYYVNSVVKRLRNYTIHNGKYNIYVKLDVVNSNGKIICNQEIDILGIFWSKVDHSKPTEEIIKKLVINDDAEIMSWINRHCAIKDGNNQPCITGKCPGYFKKESTPIKNSLQQPIICAKCNIMQCPACQCDWSCHKGLTCIEYRQTNIDEKYDTLILKEIFDDGTATLCPECMVITFKSEGCNKMHCSNCNIYWCWACRCYDLKDLYFEPYDHYKSNPRAHVGRDGKQKRCVVGGEFSDNIMHIVAKNNRNAFKILYKRYLKDSGQDEAGYLEQPGDLQRQPGDLQRQQNDQDQQPGDLQRQPGDLQRQPGDLQRQQNIELNNFQDHIMNRLRIHADVILHNIRDIEEDMRIAIEENDEIDVVDIVNRAVNATEAKDELMQIIAQMNVNVRIINYDFEARPNDIFLRNEHRFVNMARMEIENIRNEVNQIVRLLVDIANRAVLPVRQNERIRRNLLEEFNNVAENEIDDEELARRMQLEEYHN